MSNTKTKRSWALALFGLIFFAVGAGFLLVSVIPTLYEGWAMQGWHSVEGRLIDAGYTSHRGDDSTTYKAYASYYYEVNGRRYENSRVGINSGSDNVGSFQQDTGNDLASKLSRNQPVAVWYNPADPADSILVRDIRWNLLGFKTLFVLIFGGVGFGIMFAGLRGKKYIDTPETAQSPWLAEPKWRNGEIRSGAQGGMYFAWGFAGFWNLLSFPVAVAGFPEVWRDKGYVALALLLFPAVGIGLLVWAIKASLEWRRFGRTLLTLDPYPGSIGGDVGGTIQLNTRLPQNTAVKLTLSCIYSYVSGTGKNRSRRERVVWQREGFASVVPTARGCDLRFRFEVPGKLPSSETNKGDYHLWRLAVNAELEGVDLDRSFELPVYVTRQRSLHIATDSASHASAAASALTIESLLPIQRVGSTTRVEYPMLHKPGRTVLGVVFGSVFGGAGVFLWGEAADHGFMLYAMSTVFNLVGWGIALGALVGALSSRRIEFDGRRLGLTRNLLGIRISTVSVPYSQIRSVESKVGSETTYGNKHVVEHVVFAVAGHKKLTLADYLDDTVKRDFVVAYFEKELLRHIDRQKDKPEAKRVGGEEEPRFAFDLPQREAELATDKAD